MADISEFKKERKFKELQSYLEKEESASERKIEEDKVNGKEEERDRSDEAEEASFIYKNKKLKEKIKRRNIALVLLAVLSIILVFYLAFRFI